MTINVAKTLKNPSIARVSSGVAPLHVSDSVEQKTPLRPAMRAAYDQLGRLRSGRAGEGNDDYITKAH